MGRLRNSDQPIFKMRWILIEKPAKPKLISTDLNNIGKLYESWGKFDQAIRCYTEALRIDEKIREPEKDRPALEQYRDGL